jgi:hypothetical protein
MKSLSLRLRMSGSLLDVARVMRVLKRYSVCRSRVSLVRDGTAEVAAVHGMFEDARRYKGLAAVLARSPNVIEVEILDDADCVIARLFAQHPMVPSHNVKRGMP